MKRPSAEALQRALALIEHHAKIREAEEAGVTAGEQFVAQMRETARALRWIVQEIRQPERRPAPECDPYATPTMVAQREAALSVCIDPECTLSGGYAHAGPCEPCACGAEHASEECPVVEDVARCLR